MFYHKKLRLPWVFPEIDSETAEFKGSPNKIGSFLRLRLFTHTYKNVIEHGRFVHHIFKNSLSVK